MKADSDEPSLLTEEIPNEMLSIDISPLTAEEQFLDFEASAPSDVKDSLSVVSKNSTSEISTSALLQHTTDPTELRHGNSITSDSESTLEESPPTSPFMLTSSLDEFSMKSQEMERIQALEAMLSNAAAREAKLEKRIDTMEKENVVLKDSNRILATYASRLTREMMDAKLEFDNMEKEIIIWKDSNRTLANYASRLTREMMDRRSELQETKNNLSDCRRAVEANATAMLELEEKWMKSSQEAESVKLQLSDCAVELKGARVEIEHLRSELTSEQRGRLELEEKRMRSSQETESVKLQLSDCATELKVAQAEIERFKTELACEEQAKLALQDKASTLELALGRKEEKCKEQEDAFKKLSDQYRETSEQLESAEREVEDMNKINENHLRLAQDERRKRSEAEEELRLAVERESSYRQETVILKMQITDCEANAEVAQAEIESLSTELKAKSLQIEEQKKELGTLRRDMDTKREQADVIERQAGAKIHELQKNLMSKNEIIERLGAEAESNLSKYEASQLEICRFKSEMEAECKRPNALLKAEHNRTEAAVSAEKSRQLNLESRETRKSAEPETKRESSGAAPKHRNICPELKSSVAKILLKNVEQDRYRRQNASSSGSSATTDMKVAAADTDKNGRGLALNNMQADKSRAANQEFGRNAARAAEGPEAKGQWSHNPRTSKQTRGKGPKEGK
ncbi:hypothetical protein HDU96_008659 [Phlyctochytrium bullatum]|nr:hypothetical protein HDU96_008659 [Phlyctochytrium bullatum]